MKIGIIGLGKMGSLVSQNLAREHEVFGFDKATDTYSELSKVTGTANLKELVEHVGRKGIYWVMINHEYMQTFLDEFTPLLNSGAIIVDSGNNNSNSSEKFQDDLSAHNIHYICLGMSGGIQGAATQPPMILSGNDTAVKRIKPLLETLGGNYFQTNGKAHLAKAIHNAIEYGMMQSLAEGIALYANHGFSQKEITGIFKVWSKGSIIESKLTSIVCEVLKKYDLEENYQITKSETLGIILSLLREDTYTPIIQKSAELRSHASKLDPKTQTALALMRNTFGGHSVNKK